MEKLRYLVPIFGCIGLVALFFKLPESSFIFHCTSCASQNPYLPFSGAAYFALLIASSFLFPTFPNKKIGQGGIVFAAFLAIGLTYIQFPMRCIPCLIAHSCHILMWVFLRYTPKIQSCSSALGIRLCLMMVVPISIVSLFSCLNLNFIAYKKTEKLTKLSKFSLETTMGKSITESDDYVIFNFVSPNCPYCKDQLPILNAVANVFSKGPYRFVNITPVVYSELVEKAPECEWYDDHAGQMHSLFKVTTYPTLFIVKKGGEIAEIISGVPDDLKKHLLSTLFKP